MSAFERVKSSEPVKVVYKGWGREEWLVNNEDYCAKFIILESGKKMSWHFHEKKKESFVVIEGRCLVSIGDTDDLDSAREICLEPGDRLDVEPRTRHRLLGLTETRVLEISTTHFDSDSYRVLPGD